MKRGFK